MLIQERIDAIRTASSALRGEYNETAKKLAILSEKYASVTKPLLGEMGYLVESLRGIRHKSDDLFEWNEWEFLPEDVKQELRELDNLDEDEFTKTSGMRYTWDSCEWVDWHSSSC